jgi:hypothetical protein
MGFALIGCERLGGALFHYVNERYTVQTTQYEIFRSARYRTTVRIATVETLGQTEQTLYGLAWLEPGDYFTRDCTTGEIVARKSNG